MSEDDILDVAVVGGGVAGTYSAWRLLEGGSDPKKVALFEGSERIGGRLLSLRPPGMDKLVCELGGMYFANLHRMVCSVVQKLGLAVQNIPQATIPLYYLRRHRLKACAKGDVPYFFTDAEKAVDPMALLPLALETLIPGITKLHGKELEEKLRTAKVDDLPIADWGFWNLLYRAMSSEAYAFSHDSNTDDWLIMNWNAADAIRAMQLFSPATKVYHVTDGYDRIPLAIQEQIEKAGARVHMRHRLKRIDIVDGIVHLAFDKDSVGWGPAGRGTPIVVRARRVVLAMPKRSIELLDPHGPLFEDAGAQRLVGSVTSLPMFKMFCCYTTPWWKPLGYAASDCSVTDMPLRLCLYWGTEADQPGGDPTNQNSLLLTTLDDLVASSFWSGLRDPHHMRLFSERAQADATVLHGHAGAPQWHRYSDCVTDRIVTEAQKQLTEMHGIAIPEPYAAASMNWSQDPFGGAGSFWNIHARSEEIIPRMTQPVDGIPIYVCGESYSRSQGWVEGALETAELMLERHFGLKPPAWITDKDPA